MPRDSRTGLKLPEQRVRDMYDLDPDISVNAIAKALGVHWQTAKKLPHRDEGSEGLVGMISQHTLKMLELIGIGLAVLVVFLLVKMIAAIPGLIKTFVKEYLLVMIWRHFTGAHYHGRRVTDATWTRRARNTKRHEFERGGFMDRWEHKPRGHRALWRWFLTFAFLGLAYGLAEDFWVAVHAAESVAVYLLVVAAFAIKDKWRLRLHRKHVLNPTAESLAGYLGLSFSSVLQGLHIDPENITDEGEIGYYEMPPELTPGEDKQAGMARIIDAHLPVDSELEFKMQQSPKLAVIMAAQKPPAAVLWDETIEAMEHAAYGDIIIGKDKYKNVFTANFIHLEDAHWGFSVRTKYGKSSFLALVAVQVLHQDPQAQVIVVDPKEESLIDALGSPAYDPAVPNGLKPLLPGVTMANNPENPEAMWAAIGKAHKLMTARRKEYALDRTKQFPVCLLVLDELDAFSRITKKAWNNIRADNNKLAKELREELPLRCPVWDDIHDMLHMGRFVGVHIVAVAQDFRDEIIGGHGIRNGFGLRGMAGYLPNQWKYFIGTPPVPSVQRGVGRWIFCQGEEREWVQITHAEPDRAYAWAAHGRELHVPDEPEADDEPGPRTLTLVEDDVVSTLAAGAAYLGLKVETFTKRRQRMNVDATDGTAKGQIPGEFRLRNRVSWRKKDLDAWNARWAAAGKDDADEETA